MEALTKVNDHYATNERGMRKASRRIKLHELILLRIYLQRIIAASVLIQPWRGNLVRTSRALDIALGRRIKLEVMFI
jgi:hypothetical protein